MNKRIKQGWITLVLFLCCIAGAAAQQTDGSLIGKVTDSSRLPMAGATIVAIHQPSGTTYSGTADKTGTFFLPGLRIGGPYKVTVSMVGKKTTSMQQVTVRLGEPQQLNFMLAGEQKQLAEIVIQSSPRTAKANTYGTTQNITRAQLNSLPTINRSLQDITRLVPQGSKDNSFAGTNFRYNNITVDGAINNDAIGFSPSAGGITGTSGAPGASTRSNAISLDAIEDMQVYLAPYDVKIGNFTGGSINAVTRSGTNIVTGSVYAFGRNAAITGKDKIGSLGKMNSDFYDYQAGVRVGFPIIKNKLFFFTNEEITRRRDPAQLMAGQPETAQILSAKDADDIRNFTIGHYGAIFDPGTAGAYNSEARSEKYFNRLDWNINDNNQLSVRNNTIFSRSVNMDRDQMDFRFSAMAYRQTNNQTSTVVELKTKFHNGFSNSLIVGYSSIHDYRDPLSDPSLPQIQIMGRTPGTTIYMGTDREAAIFNMKQRTWEITNNLTWHKGKHTMLLGTHNELYHISYGFVNSWNGRVDYLSIEDYLHGNPYRVRGNYNYTNNSRDYILSHPEAVFDVDMLSAYFQDEIRITDRFRITPGLRADYSLVPNKQPLSNQVKTAYTDSYFGNTYTYTPLSRITNNYLNHIQVSPRIGFRYDVTADGRLVLRGGAGLFTGRIPLAWLGYAFYNTGIHYGSYDQKADQQPFAAGTDPVKPGANGIADFIAKNGTVVNSPQAGKTQVDLVDNNFSMPKVLRTNLALDYTTLNGYKLGLEGLYTKTIKDVYFQQVNIKDNPRYFGYDTKHEQPVYSGAVDPRFANAYELSNTSLGYRYSVTGTVSKRFNMGVNASVAYTYGGSKDAFNGIRNSMESNWQLNQALNPNNAGLAWSNFDIRHRLIVNLGYQHAWNEKWTTTLNLFVSAQSGSPFTYGIVNNSLQGLPQQLSLAYIPQHDEAIRFFQDYADAGGAIVTAAQQADAFNTYIDGNKYLSSRRGGFTARNAGRTPWNTTADLHFAQEFHFPKSSGFITLTIDIMNFTNLINANWGRVYFSPNTFNSTASVGLAPVLFPQKQNAGNYPVFRFADPGKPYAIDYFNSRAQGQLGVRYSF
ncbi:carboxypeptidase family protein [Chitinophaga polysaccharea]|uniref:Carboxypeptidase family protein n=1 Tax=Chitinophaga polysaccharea TaxID=1293035 RepID=A0A561PP95_9BACT|nr:carboxypeptidase regulatory-like domain-containing protein [Chitinophaga polysaccharea]TWF39927.1 carboxypeptidase family protein [Chitinophaga polysaccharea]